MIISLHYFSRVDCFFVWFFYEFLVSAIEQASDYEDIWGSSPNQRGGRESSDSGDASPPVAAVVAAAAAAGGVAGVGLVEGDMEADADVDVSSSNSTLEKLTDLLAAADAPGDAKVRLSFFFHSFQWNSVKPGKTQ